MKQKARHSGFTLAEIAVVLAIIGIAMTMGLKMLTATFENSAYSETKAKQERIKLALVSFMRSNGRLPCPDTTALLANPTGVEAAACTFPPLIPALLAANRAAGSGVVPWATLGLPREAVLDGWGNYFTYRVANFVAIDPVTSITVGGVSPPLHLYNNHNWTSRIGFDIRSLTTPASAPSVPVPSYATFTIQTRLTPAALPTDEARNAVVVILSHGKNGLGARTTRPVAVAALPAAAVAPDERQTGTPGTIIFYRRAVNDVAIDAANNPGGPIDDVVAYLTPQELLQPLINEKTLKGQCQAYCDVATAGTGCTPLIPASGPQITVGNSVLLAAPITTTCP
jgi:prepilin-type N-terminal cleavage/methylation domain-containing protein